MSLRWRNSLATLAAAVFTAVSALAQNGTFNDYSPYSVYGIGQLHDKGTAFNESMGGVGIATRTRRYVNILNPASITARDSLSFMADFGLNGKASYYPQGDLHSANNIMNINDFVISFPIYRRSAMMIGITPYSNVGYNFTYVENDPMKVGKMGNQGYTVSGSGSIYQIFAGGAVTLWNRLSLGAEYILYFGTINRDLSLTFVDETVRDISTGHVEQLRSHTGKFGLQYEQPVGGGKTLTLGATYKLSTPVGGYSTDETYASMESIVDTISFSSVHLTGTDKLKFASEIGIGLSLRAGERWLAEVDYTRSDWTGSGFDNVSGFRNNSAFKFSSSVAQMVRAGFAFTPNRNDIRYFYRRITYRGGLYCGETYFKLDNNPVTSYGLTLGATIPVSRGYNGVTFGLDIGKRGTAKNGMVRENYIGFNFGVNIFDIWFQKSQYK